MYNKFRTPESILVIAQFTMPLLGCMALQQIFSISKKESWLLYNKPIKWSFLPTIFLCVIGITSKTTKGGIVVFSEVYFPWGWHATIDGKPVEITRVNYILRALHLPQEEHKIEMWFDPQSLHTTVTIAIISIILIDTLLITACSIAINRSRISNL